VENVTINIQLLSLLVSSLGVLYLAFWAFRELRMDEFRQNVFRLRDELFDYAVAGNIALDHPAYMMLRSLMNGYIRFSHRLSLSHFVGLTLSTYFTNRSYFASSSFDKQWRQATASLDENTKAKLDEFRERTSLQLFQYLLLSSYTKKAFALTIVTTLLLVIMVLRGKAVFRAIKRLVKTHVDFEVWAYKYSKQHSVKVRESIDTFNAGAYAFGKIQAV
jgi:hypothetical protein